MKTIIAIMIGIILTVLGIGMYLSPNDLSGCGKVPSGTPPCERADAIVAVSGGDTSARTAEAVKLYEAGWADKLIFSGAARDKSGPSNAAALSAEAEAAGVPPEDIILEEFGETTKQNAENTHDIFDLLGIEKVILVTSGYHQRRASLEFAALSTGATLRNHPVSEDQQWSSWWWATPQGWYLAVSELVKIIIFYAGGGR
jgi:uncharacterized SAM-binding protein YcdF (DUF218 family)